MLPQIVMVGNLASGMIVSLSYVRRVQQFADCLSFRLHTKLNASAVHTIVREIVAIIVALDDIPGAAGRFDFHDFPGHFDFSIRLLLGRSGTGIASIESANSSPRKARSVERIRAL